MDNYRFERNARRSRQIALVATLVFHLGLAGGLAFFHSGNLAGRLVDSVQSVLKTNRADQAAGEREAESAKKRVVQP